MSGSRTAAALTGLVLLAGATGGCSASAGPAPAPVTTAAAPRPSAVAVPAPPAPGPAASDAVGGQLLTADLTSPAGTVLAAPVGSLDGGGWYATLLLSAGTAPATVVADLSAQLVRDGYRLTGQDGAHATLVTDRPAAGGGHAGSVDLAGTAAHDLVPGFVRVIALPAPSPTPTGAAAAGTP